MVYQKKPELPKCSFMPNWIEKFMIENSNICLSKNIRERNNF